MSAPLAVEPAPAKVNLALHVTGQRDNGYHNLESLVVFAEVGDELEAMPSAAKADRLTISGPFAGALTAGQSNLVLKAVTAFRAQWPGAVASPLDFKLAKNLPVAAGIGGGSADAAAALRLMRDLSTVEIPVADLRALAETLGADVPVCLFSHACLVHGIGDLVRPVKTLPASYLVLVNPLQPLRTPDVFRALSRRENPPLPDLPITLSHAAMLGMWMEETRNDLEQPARALVPAIGEIVDLLKSTGGCMAARMSGSGATVFGLYGSAALAHQAAHDVRLACPDYWVAAAPVIRPQTTDDQ